MIDAENAALEWLDGLSEAVVLTRNVRHIATLKAMLAQPRLPEEPSEEAITRILCATWGVRMEGSQNAKEIAKDVYRALYAHLTRPNTKTVWRVTETEEGRTDFYDFDSMEDALGRVKVCAEHHRLATTIERREVPND